MYKKIFITIFSATFILLSLTNILILAIAESKISYLILEFIICVILCLIVAKILADSITKSFRLDSTTSPKNKSKLIKNQLKGLKQNQNKMLLLTQNMSDGLILLNKQGKILLTNKKASEYIRNITKIINISEVDDNSFLQKVSFYLDTLKKGDKQKIERINLYDKECEILFCPVYSKKDYSKRKFKGIIIILRDISAEIAMQNMRKEFSANVTHELKTPLTSILASSEMISNDLVKDEDLKTFIDKIEKEAKKLLKMIDEILKLSFLDENSTMTKDKVSLKTITKNVLDRLQIIAKKQKINIYSSLENTYILGNEQLLENLIYNLVDNAIKYNKKNGYIKITLHSKNNNAIFSIKDSGIGIPQNAQDRIFERFYCVDKSKSNALGGSGLGLSIVKSVAKYHDAKIELNSKENKGSEFIITFPLQS